MGSSLREALLPSRAFRRQPPGVMGIWQLRSHGAPVGGVGDELVKGRVAGATPLDRTGVDPGGQVEFVLKEPEEGLAYAAQFGDLVDGEADRRLDAPVGVLFQPVAHLDEADRGRNDKLAAACLLMACRERALPQKVELVLVEAALETQEQAVVALARCVDRLLVDEERVDDAAHFNELLPISAVARKARDLPGGHCADLAQADLGDHALETGARGPAGGRAAEVLVDDLDLRPAELRETVAHGVLEPPTLAVVLDLMSGGLTDVEHRLAGPVLGADLVSAHRRRPRVGHPASERRWRARRAGGSEAPSASAAPAPAERTKPAESLASPAGLSDRGRVDGAAFAAGDKGAAWRSPQDSGDAIAAPVGAPRIASESRARKAASADRAATGCAVVRAVRHTTASSIQTGTGISCGRAMVASTRLQRADAPVALSIP